jgi:hypothetical protein
MANITVQCQCGTVAGKLENVSAGSGTRLMCYCSDCQAYARAMKAEYVMNAYGGTDIFQVPPGYLTFHQGVDRLISLRLKEGGLTRWYSDCCQTPIANTVSATMPFVGLILNSSVNVFDQKALGNVRYHVQAEYAEGQPSGVTMHKGFPFGLLLRNFPLFMWAKLRGKAAESPFYKSSGDPISEPVVHLG